jgi:hypothetical protein
MGSPNRVVRGARNLSGFMRPPNHQLTARAK